MSDLMQLRARLDQIARDAKATAGNLSSFQGRFSRQIGEIQQAISGTATRTDQSMIEALSQADKRIAAAVAALEQVAGIAGRYGSSL